MSQRSAEFKTVSAAHHASIKSTIQCPFWTADEQAFASADLTAELPALVASKHTTEQPTKSQAIDAAHITPFQSAVSATLWPTYSKAHIAAFAATF